MIENNPSNVTAAFDILVEEIEAEIDFVNQVGAAAFGKRDYDRVKEAMEHTTRLTVFRDKVVGLRREWESASQLRVEEEDAAHRQNLGRLQRGLRTREEAYYNPILSALDEMGGAGKMSDVLEKIERTMQGILKKVDYEPLASSPDMPRWRNAACWARNSMINESLLKGNSPRGIWEITEKGRQYLKGLV